MRKGEKNVRGSYGRIMSLALPIVIQNLFSAAISSTDVIMLNSVGQSSISAVSLAVLRHYRSRKWLHNITREDV